MKSIITFIGILSFVAVQSQDSETDTFRICNEEKMYAVDFYILMDSLGDDFKDPRHLPDFNGKHYYLKNHFKGFSLKNTSAEDNIVRLYLAFIVNCEGKAGNFFIIGDRKPEFKDVEERVLNIARTMPQKWLPAEHRRNKVDCYQVIHITIFNGQFTNLFWEE